MNNLSLKHKEDKANVIDHLKLASLTGGHRWCFLDSAIISLFPVQCLMCVNECMCKSVCVCVCVCASVCVHANMPVNVFMCWDFQKKKVRACVYMRVRTRKLCVIVVLCVCAVRRLQIENGK
jgi:hypothetical protein